MERQKPTVFTIPQENPNIIPDVIPDVKKPLEPPILFEEYDEEDIKLFFSKDEKKKKS